MPRQRPPPGPGDQRVQRQAEQAGPQRRGQDHGGGGRGGGRGGEVGGGPHGGDAAGDDAGADRDDDRDRRGHPDAGDDERGGGRQADAPDHVEPPEPERGERLLGQRVYVVEPVDRVEQDRPDGRVRDQGNVHLQ